MGERLNIEIKENGIVLANAYYHWSGYTSSSIRLTQIVLDNIDKINYENKIITAIKLLETTGSGMANDEMEFGKKIIDNFESYNFKQTTGRNDGLTAISEKQIKETEYWEEHRVEINLDTKVVKFGVIWENTKEEFTEEHEDYNEEEYTNIPIHNINFNNIPFDKFKEFGGLILNLIKEKIYNIKLKGDEKVYCFIE